MTSGWNAALGVVQVLATIALVVALITTIRASRRQREAYESWVEVYLRSVLPPAVLPAQREDADDHQGQADRDDQADHQHHG